MDRTRVLVVRYKNDLSHSEIKLFRGAVNDAMKNADPLFHNHNGDGFIYAYPKIQYKRINNKAAIVCVNEGADIIGQFFSAYRPTLKIGKREESYEVDYIKADQYIVQIWDNLFEYHLRKWISFNQDNYREYLKMEGISEKFIFLENILTGNILSFAKGIGVFFDEKVVCKITSIEEPQLTEFKGIKMTSFDLTFKTNVSIPNYIGLGKGVSIGYGVVTRKIIEK